MDWPEGEELTAGLPSPHDDEPANLRRDIADELQDHLACAMDREIRKTTDDQAAKAAALQQFGSPTQIARRLWWDAMKERIMSQRITLFAATMAGIASIVVCWMAWQIADQSRTTNLALLEQSRDMNRELLNKLAAIPSAPATTQSLEWTPLKVRLVSGKKGGPPAVGFKVRIWKQSTEISDGYQRDETTSANGIADLGILRTGSYQLTISSPWNQHLQQAISLHAGEPNEIEVICPSSKPEDSEVTMRIDWPDDLRKKGLWLQFNLERAEMKVDGEQWTLHDGRAQLEGIVLADSGQIMQPKSDRDWNPIQILNYYYSPAEGPGGESDRPFEHCVFDRSATCTRKTVQCVDLPYYLTGLTVVEPPTTAGEPSRQSLKVLGRRDLKQVRQVSPSLGPLPSFSPTPGGKNAWVIKLPEQLINHVRTNLDRAGKPGKPSEL